MRDKQLQLEYMEDQLAECEKNYKEIASTLSVEGDIPRKNQLKKQLEGLGEQIQKIEPEIQRLKQEIQQESLQDLITLLKEHENQFGDMAVAYQMTIRNWSCPVHSKPTTVPTIIAELQKIPTGQSANSAVEEFVACLVSQTQDNTLLMALQNWGGQLHNWAELRERVETHQAQRNQDAQPVVMIEISCSDEASTQKPSGTYYRIKAWLIQDREQYRQRPQNYVPVELSGLTGEDVYSLSDLVTTIPQVLSQLIGEWSQGFTNDPEIHIFLPLELMNQDVDCWLLNDGPGRAKPLGHEYKVVLRFAERVSRSYRYRSRWLKKWQHHQALLQICAFQVFVSGDESNLEELSYALDEVSDTTVGLKVIQAPTQVEPDGLFGVLFQSGLPLALWGRCDLKAPTNEVELDRVLQAGCLEVLPDTVKRNRREARNQAKDCHIGHHLSLLWDDPDLFPPKSA